MKEIIPPNKQLTPQEYEQKLLDLEANPTKNDPMDVHAAMFKYYNPRFQGQLNFMSKKQILQLASDLVGSSYNQKADINKIITLSKDLGISALKRVVAGVVENPLAEVELSLTNDKEKRLFTLFDSLLTNKYFNCIQTGLQEQAKNPEIKHELEDFIIHTLDLNSSDFKKREKQEKDGFFTGNKLLCSKYIMLMVSQNEYMKAHPELLEEMKKLKEKENG